jgi:hypothetical protein
MGPRAAAARVRNNGACGYTPTRHGGMNAGLFEHAKVTYSPRAGTRRCTESVSYEPLLRYMSTIRSASILSIPGLSDREAFAFPTKYPRAKSDQIAQIVNVSIMSFLPPAFSPVLNLERGLYSAKRAESLPRPHHCRRKARSS